MWVSNGPKSYVRQIFMSKRKMVMNRVLNMISKSKKVSEDYFAVMIQLNYEQETNEKAKTFFAGIYYELTANFGFNFCDRVFYRVDTKESIIALIRAAFHVVALQQRLSKEDISAIIKHAFIIPLHQFDDVRKDII